MQNPRVLLLAITALFVAPLLLAILMRSSWWDFKPAELSNRGTLIQPPVALALEQLDRVPGTTARIKNPAWLVLLKLNADCTMECLETLAQVRQVHLASGKHRDKIGIWLVSPAIPTANKIEAILAIYTEFELFVDGKAAFSNATAKAQSQRTQTGNRVESAKAFVVDPAANIILSYEPDFDPGDLADDLDRLLTWSKQD